MASINTKGKGWHGDIPGHKAASMKKKLKYTTRMPMERKNKIPYPYDTDDLENVQEWFEGKVISFEAKKVGINIFKNQIDEMESALRFNLDSTEDIERIETIYDRLKDGEETYAIFVDGTDNHNFILEGRHRIVAFSRLGLKTIPVYYVRMGGSK